MPSRNPVLDDLILRMRQPINVQDPADEEALRIMVRLGLAHPQHQARPLVQQVLRAVAALPAPAVGHGQDRVAHGAHLPLFREDLVQHVPAALARIGERPARRLRQLERGVLRVPQAPAAVSPSATP